MNTEDIIIVMTAILSAKQTSDRNNRILLIVYINIILYATCFQLQRPLEPFLIDKLTSSTTPTASNIINESSDNNKSSNEYARLQSFFSIIQTFGSLITGYLLDKYTTKLGFLITFIASALSYYILSISTTMSLLYLSKVPSLLQAGIPYMRCSLGHLTLCDTSLRHLGC